MHSTETKPHASRTEPGIRYALRVVFCVRRPVSPPPIVIVPCEGVQIGREIMHGLRLEDTRVSRNHASVRRDARGGLVVQDDKSKNGTYVNGTQVEEQELFPGDVISVGDTCLVVGREPDVEDASVPQLAGDSWAMRRARLAVQRIAPTQRTVLLLAESGCGKEVVSRAIHASSGLRGDFVPVNCAAVPESLFESQLFGHAAGAFTGASAHKGFFRAAIGGTLLLDEVGELPLALQPKLLRAIEERAVVPLGATQPLHCPVRIVAATNRDLADDVEQGKFRGDLLARLFEAEVVLPPLRERREDILQLFELALGDVPCVLTHALAEALLLHRWPFNVRELKAVARDMASVATDGPLDVEAFRPRIVDRPSKTVLRHAVFSSTKFEGVPLGREELSKLLLENGGVVADVARAVGRSRRQVYRWIIKYGLQVDAFRR